MIFYPEKEDGEEELLFSFSPDGLEGKVDADVFANIKERFGRQLYNAREWRDQVNTYFYRKSGISDEKGRTIY